MSADENLIRRRLAFPRIHDLVALLPQATAAEARRMVQTAGEIVELAGLDRASR